MIIEQQQNRDTITPKIHPTQKPIETLKKLIELFTDVGEE